MSSILKEHYDLHDAERFVKEGVKTSNRTDFARDRARILHSSGFRRLESKTQVYSPEENDFIRTRLTHSIEVSQIGRQIGDDLGSDSDIVDAACLAHDLGHPPFGHNGEAELDEIANEIGGFEGNAQTFRLLTRLEPKVFVNNRSVGLNLTRATLDASMKYPFRRGSAPPNISPNKFGVYEDDLEIYNWIKEKVTENEQTENRRPIEADIMDFADDVSYSVHDFEDGIVSQAINFQRLKDRGFLDHVLTTYSDKTPACDTEKLLHAFNRLDDLGFFNFEFTGSRHSYADLKEYTSRIIGHFTVTAIKAMRKKYGNAKLIRYTASLHVPPEIRDEIELLKAIEYTLMMVPRNETRRNIQERETIHELKNLLMQYSPEPSPLLSSMFLEDWHATQTDNERLRIAVDQIATLTDSTAKKLIGQLVAY
ncbi:MAG: deoxyguanosinetriphosphate triphosphohydrolase [Bifidobacteriaceae bacterium]|jgi:dGTPase|nr:deoxyguanosinetriphosphate triphosphohydrolase [Bifidobacteriaceae bacterium]